MAARAGEHEHATSARVIERGNELRERVVIDRVATLGAVDRRDDDIAAPLDVDAHYSRTTTTSPSWTWSSGLTRISATVPATGATTGISIFIDSRITSSSPSSTR